MALYPIAYFIPAFSKFLTFHISQMQFFFPFGNPESKFLPIKTVLVQSLYVLYYDALPPPSSVQAFWDYLPVSSGSSSESDTTPFLRLTPLFFSCSDCDSSLVSSLK